MNNYILDGKEVKQVDLITWATWYEKADRVVKKTEICGTKVSTVFLGIDHSFGGKIPILFETMIFGGTEDGYCERYTTWEEAEKGHQEACDLVLRNN